MGKRVVIIALVVFSLGCQQVKDRPLAGESSEAIRTAIEGFETYVSQWRERVDSGQWEAMIADGSCVDLIPEEQRGTIDPKSYPEIRIAELEDAIAKMRDELARRSD